MEPAAVKQVCSYAVEGDIEGLQTYVDSATSHNEEVKSILWETGEAERNVLSVACMLGRSRFVRELAIKYEADVNMRTARGYSPVHYSAMWGQLDTLKTLVELGADLEAGNFRGEKAINIAQRYSKFDCVNYLTWVEAKKSLQASIIQVKHIIDDTENVQRKIEKEEMNICINIHSEVSDWLQNTKDPPIQDFIEKKRYLEEVLVPIMAKLTPQ